ncbi:MAG: DUF5009 domain-containing protein [Melioribacteraceae bacterium]|nr:MAG: DUF5009 domain-containing protein [Melioribacteraceae bacterium]
MTNRSYGLDALRGFAILTMFLSGLLPFYKNTLPAWMYHAQVPPPLHKFNPEVFGITWVDLVFPFFIFAMGAAIPLALRKQIENGTPVFKIILKIVERFLLLAGFAIYIQHIKPYAISPEPDLHVWMIALIGFIAIFPVLLRMPRSFSTGSVRYIRIAGYLLIPAIILYIQLVFKKPFSLYKSDIIILVLSNIYLVGSILWLFTRKSNLLRFSVFGILIALRLGHESSGIANLIWNISPFPWLFKIYFLQYLFILIPGTIAGDMILKYSEVKIDKPKSDKWLILFATLTIIHIPLLLYGLFTREVVTITLVAIGMSAMAYYLLRKSASGAKSLLTSMFASGVFFLFLGLLFESYEGGIRKDHATMSYYFVTSGLAFYTLSALIIIIDIYGKKWLNLFVTNGQNPMIAYAGISNLIPPLLGITGVGSLLDMIVISPWMGFVKGLFITLLLAVIVNIFTKRKIFLRA